MRELLGSILVGAFFAAIMVISIMLIAQESCFVTGAAFLAGKPC